MLSDIEIAASAELMPITDIVKKLNIESDNVEQYGNYKAKIDIRDLNLENNNSKLILVTAINPTKAGEGKTTVSIGLADGLNKIGCNTVLALREPSMGPVFGLKGSATGGGYAQVIPMEDINLHFTGDMHAITSAANLIAAVLDNHIYHGNKLNISLKSEDILWKRCLDVNDRALRTITTGYLKDKKIDESFTITAASEVMAILCLSNSINELTNKLNSIIVALDVDGNPITVKDLNIGGALTVLLKDAIKPNLVQTLEHTPVFMHGGPFANIAHGCNSILATKMALKYSDYVVTEAGFGAELGAEKFLDIKCRLSRLKPACVVLVATIRALKMHGGIDKNNLHCSNPEAVKCGFKNLLHHYTTLTKEFGLNVIVALNRFTADTNEELSVFDNECIKNNMLWKMSDGWANGGNGNIELAHAVKQLTEIKTNFKYLYTLDQSIYDKVKNICLKAYNVSNVKFSNEAISDINNIERLGYNMLPVCIAKTPLCLNDGNSDKNSILISSVSISAGAGFLVVKTGNIMTMPGLPEHPLAENIYLTNDGRINGMI